MPVASDTQISAYGNDFFDERQFLPFAMAGYNNLSNFYENPPQGPSVMNQEISRNIDISTSNLEPTAQEFHPQNRNNGATKKVYSNRPNKYQNRSKYYNKSNYSEDRNKILDETKQFLQSFNQVNNDDNVSVSSYHSNSSRPNSSKRYSENRNKNRQDENTQSKGNTERYNSHKNGYSSNSRYYDNNSGYNGYKNHRSDNHRGENHRSDNHRSDNHRSDNHRNENYRSDFYQRRNYGENEELRNSPTEFNSRESYNQRNSSYNDKRAKNNYYDRNNWRANNEYYVKEKDKNKKLDAASQRDRLEEMLNRRMLECLVCCEKIKNNDKVWSCKQCYHILHLSCIISWAKSSKIESGWRCPACQNVCDSIPKTYTCYCDKTIDPKLDPGIIPHSCGEVCLRKGRTCDHKCTILCHPGPCPDCIVMVNKPCGCGKTKQSVKCCTEMELVCDSVCEKYLECGIHKCKAQCHPGECEPCQKRIVQECYCGKLGRKVPCTSEHKGSTKFFCDDVCDNLLSCGNHKCTKMCHAGSCDMCPVDVSLIKTCPCGKTLLEKPRTSCLDPVPSCGKTCGKKLVCGQPSAPHVCESKCHLGACPPCPMTTLVRCRCGHMDKELACENVTTKADDARCEKKCTKKRLCGKHRCNQRCCIEIEHFCPLPCNKLLSCGQHRCERTCHNGRCPQCLETSFEELYCECGSSVIYPPVPCGTKPPNCNKPCSRQRPCGHETNHSCHTGPCPPCTVFVKRWCYGKHEQRAAIPCHQTNFSCGLPCSKDMPCKEHKCIKPCHDGECALPCKQPCTKPRSLCGHPCGKPCHKGPCPETSCRFSVNVTCQCGLLKQAKLCIDVADEYRNLEMSRMKDKLGDLAKEHSSVDISELVAKPKKPAVLKILECNDECKIYERNRRLAIGLQIRNPDLSQKLTPRYSDFMRQWAKKDKNFCQKVHDKLTELVQLAKQSKQKSRSHSFDSMNRDKRHFIHEYCEHFGIESAAYDPEPNRNVVATALREKSWLPSISLMEFVQRENGQRKVPGPVSLNESPSTSSASAPVTLMLPGRSIKTATQPVGEFIDYFNNP